MGFRMLRTAAALVTVLLLAGCVPREPVITPEPDPASTPVFASDEEALAAATEAYARYLEVSDQIAQDGGSRVDRISSHVTVDQGFKEIENFGDLKDSGRIIQGPTKFDTLTLQQHLTAADGTETVTVYLCLDVSSTLVLDVDGNDVTPVDRTNRLPLEVEFEVARSEPKELLVSRSEPWSGTNFCV